MEIAQVLQRDRGGAESRAEIDKRAGADPGLWRVDDLISAVVARVVETGENPAVAIDAMSPIRLPPEDERLVLREGLRSLVNGTGLRTYRRSGKIQSARTHIQPLAEESAGLDDYFDRQLRRLIFETADGRMRTVADFSHDDALHAYSLRVLAPRSQAATEEPSASNWTRCRAGSVLSVGAACRTSRLAREKSIRPPFVR